MPRPKNKEELIDLAQLNYAKLLNHIDSLPVDDQLAEFHNGTMNRNIRDVLAHLHEWHLLLLKWYEVGMTGVKPEMPAPGFTWKTTRELNAQIWERNNKIDLAEVRTALNFSHNQVVSIMLKHSDAELFEKKRFKWTGTTSVGAYLISATSSHYDWAFKLIKKGLKPA